MFSAIQNKSKINTSTCVVVNTNCNHYKDVKCSLVAPCCNKIYSCYRCHDENEDHVVYSTYKNISCNVCGHIQKKSNKCEMCEIKFAKYMCSKCQIWSNKDMYHCNKCGCCKEGKKQDYFHCDKCGCCMNKRLINHVCIENITDDNCVICLESLKKNFTNLKKLRCGHILHLNCYSKLLKCGITKCPTCNAKI